MFDTNFRDVPNFIKTSLSRIKNSHLKSTHGVLSEVSKNKLSDFMFGQYYLQTIDFIESNIYKLFAQQTRTKKTEKTCLVSFFDNKGVKFINTARILKDPDYYFIITHYIRKILNIHGNL